jgi:hypothetical protein
MIINLITYISTMPLPPFCLQTHQPHTDKNFCPYCGLAESYQPIPLSTIPTPSSSTSLASAGGSGTPIELPDSPLPLHTNPLSPTHTRVAEASKDFTNKKQSSRENLKAGFSARAPAVSARGGRAPGQPATTFKFLIALITQEWVYKSKGHEGKGIRTYTNER